MARPAVARIWTPGNLGVQVYWGSRDEIRAYAGDDIEKTHHLPKDHEYLLELPPCVKHYEVLFSERD